MTSREFLASLVPNAVVNWHVPSPPDDEYWGECSNGVFTFTTTFDALSETEQRFIILHEYAHLITDDGGRHGNAFYANLTPALLAAHSVPLSIARELEQLFPDSWYEDDAQAA
jgi:hypothetical protein